VREKRAIATFNTTSPIFIGSRSLNLSQFCRPFSVFFQRKKAQRPPGIQQVRRSHDVLRQRRQLTAEVAEDLDEHRNEEHEHSDEHERREDQHHRRIDHRALDAAANRLLLLDLERDAVEHDVEDAGCFSGLDHRDIQPAEHLGMAPHRL
jgi:hypothetical protein